MAWGDMLSVFWVQMVRDRLRLFGGHQGSMYVLWASPVSVLPEPLCCIFA